MDGGLVVVSRWSAPEGVARLNGAQRVAFCLVCTEHLWPSFKLQATAFPESLSPETLSILQFRQCQDTLWGWLSLRQGEMPACVAERHVNEAYSGAPVGLFSLVREAVAALWYARLSYRKTGYALHPGAQTLEIVGQLADELTGPRPRSSDVDEDVRLQGEWLDALARHELVMLERSAQDEALAALTAGAQPGDVREGAIAVGERIASWTAQVLRPMAEEE